MKLNFRIIFIILNLCLSELAWSVINNSFKRSKEVYFIQKKEVELNKHSIVLGDIINCKGSLLVCEEINSIYLKSSPKAGASLTLYRNEISSLLKSKINHAISITGSNVTKVSSAVFEIPITVVLSMIRKLVNENIENKNSFSRFDITRVKAFNKLNIRPGPFKVFLKNKDDFLEECLIFQRKRIYQRKLKAIIEITSENEKEKIAEYKISISLLKKMKALKAIKSIIRHKPLNKESFEEVWISGSSLLNYPAIDVDFTSYMLRRSLKEGQIIRGNNLIPLVLINKGKRVDLIYNSGVIKITSKVIALEKGAPKQKIMVQVESTGKKILASILNDETVIR